MKKQKWSTHKVLQETKDTITIFFNTGEATIVYQAGQYLTITCSINGEQVSRSYSFSSVASDPFPAITVKRIIGGKMSNYLVENAEYISEWDIEAPFGNFVLNKPLIKDSSIVFLAGGSGISPLFSMLRSLENTIRKPLLLYANKTADDVIFKSQLEQFQRDNPLTIFYSFSANTENDQEQDCINGRFSQPIIQSIIKQQIESVNTAHYFICGPTALMQLYKEALSSLHIAETQIHIEYFDPILVDNIVLDTDNEPKEVLVSYFESHYLNNELNTCECTCLIEVQSGQSLLDAMRENNIRVPSACKKGTCGSCWAIKEDGNVQMNNNYALTDEEIAEGKILLCQSFPLDQSVSIVIG